MCFVSLSEQTVNFSLYNINRLVFINEVEIVYCAVRTESLYNTDTSRYRRVEAAALNMDDSDRKCNISRASMQIHSTVQANAFPDCLQVLPWAYSDWQTRSVIYISSLLVSLDAGQAVSFWL
jgi:hypothetical protein